MLYDHAGVRRRVYDALNVLMAMDIIVMDKKNIKSGCDIYIYIYIL